MSVVRLWTLKLLRVFEMAARGRRLWVSGADWRLGMARDLLLQSGYFEVLVLRWDCLVEWERWTW